MPAYALAALMMIASGSIHAVVNAIVKGGRDKAAGRAVTDGTSALILLPATLFVPLPHGAWFYLAASALIHGLYLYALVRAYKAGDLSAVYPVLRGTAPLVTAGVTIGLLGEHATAGQIAGIALIGAAMFMMIAGRHLGRAALGWSLLTGLCIAGYTVVDATGVRAAPSAASYIVWVFVQMGVVVVAMFGLLSRGAMFAAARAQWRPGAIAGILSILTYGLALTAFSLGPTAPLAALRETGMVTALLISILFLKERATAGRIIGVFGILGGAALILAG
ncbi:DMT family transporter [Sphingomonas sp. QA11]|uniref:DMT family transporter n=1 Tax=Sphingomonas sp. QA11 TaxID=2950605 RepID=UPI002349178C|nr:DMT family transporter [Sphingomonas sp. QA11]WCM26374.1 DMT family transporter [Sphingomonas sp. QA11]